MRTIIQLPAEDVSKLDELAAEAKVSRAEMVRRAVSAFLNRPRRITDHSAFGLWKDRNIDALEYEDEIRKEWSR